MRVSEIFQKDVRRAETVRPLIRLLVCEKSLLRQARLRYAGAASTSVFLRRGLIFAKASNPLPLSWASSLSVAP